MLWSRMRRLLSHIGSGPCDLQKLLEVTESEALHSISVFIRTWESYCLFLKMYNGIRFQMYYAHDLYVALSHCSGRPLLL